MNQRIFLVLFTSLLLAGLLLTAGPVWAKESPAKYAGTYRIANWEDMEKKNLYHFFYLHHSGDFLLASQWPGREESRAVGTWRVAGTNLSLSGVVEVNTNKGNWKVPFNRTYELGVSEVGILLKPVLRKNRFGMLGWPDRFVFYRTAPVPNLPSDNIPRNEKNLLLLIQELQRILK